MSNTPLEAFDKFSHPWYTPERDGSLAKYLSEKEDSIYTFPLFKGLLPYQELIKRGYLTPNISVIRLMWSSGRGDEHFGVVDNFQLEGIEVQVHAGRKGIHRPEDIFTDKAPCWEAQMLNSPKIRDDYKKESNGSQE